MEVGHRTRCYVKSSIHRYLTVPCSLTNVTFPVSCSDKILECHTHEAHAIKYQAHLLSTYFLGFYNYRGEVTDNINIYHGDEDSLNFADEKDVLRRKKSKAVVSTVDWSPSGQAKLAKIDPIDFCRVKASSSRTSSTPSTKNRKKNPKTFARNSEKHFWTEKNRNSTVHFRKYKSIEIGTPG